MAAAPDLNAEHKNLSRAQLDQLMADGITSGYNCMELCIGAQHSAGSRLCAETPSPRSELSLRCCPKTHPPNLPTG